MIIVNLQGVLTPAEYRVCKTQEGLLNIKRTRSELVESGQDDLMQLILDITGVSVSSFHSDLSTITGERVIVFKQILIWKSNFKLNVVNVNTILKRHPKS